MSEINLEEKRKPRKRKSDDPSKVILKYESPATIHRKLLEEGKKYHLDKNEIFIRTARNAAEEYELIYRMRKQIDAEGFTVEQDYKTGTRLAAHPLIEQLPRHLDCLNRILDSLSDIIEKSGAKSEEVDEDLSSFRIV